MSLARFYRRIRYGAPVVVISGLPRSGTSMLMKMLEAGGLDLVTDGLRTPDEDNPKGYYEIERVKNLAREADTGYLRQARGKGIKVISYLLKDLPPNLNYRVVFVNRDLREVLASQAKMLARRGEPGGPSDERMLELFGNDLWKARYLLKHRPEFETLEVRYAQVVEKPLAEARRIASFVGVGLDPERMAAVVDRELYRNRAEGAQAAKAEKPA